MAQRAILRLCDEYDRLRSLHRFCYNAVEELMHREDIDFDSKMLNGLGHFVHWLQEQDKVPGDLLGQLLEIQKQADGVG